MPFITEEIWQALPHKGETLMLEKYPEYNSNLDFPNEASEFEKIMDVIKAVRNRRSEMNVPPSKKAKVYIDTKFADTFNQGVSFIEKLAFASEVIIDDGISLEGATQVITDAATVYIPTEELVDFEKELIRLNKELSDAKKDYDVISSKLNNENFVSRAPQNVVEAEKLKLSKIIERIKKVEESINKISK